MTMLSYAHGAYEEPLLGETIGHNLERTAARVPDAEALVCSHQGVRYTYAEFDDAVNRLAGGMFAAGLRKGDRVGVWSPNRAEWTLTQYATAKLGIILVNLNPAYRANELEYALGHSGCRWIFAAAELKGASFIEIVQQVRPRVRDLERAVFFGSPEWEELASTPTASTEEIRRQMNELDFDEPINIQYTSGTTGFPKGATLSHHNVLNNGYFIGELLGYTERDRICIPVPLYHCFGMVIGNLAATTHGSCMVYPAETFDPEATLAACAAEKCTSLYGVPTMFIAMLGHPKLGTVDLELRTGIMAGSPCPVEVMKRVAGDMGIGEMGIAFGMTETSPVTTQVRRDDTLENRCATVGQVMPHVEIKIVDPDTGRTVPCGEPGEFLARGYPVMSGYWNEPERTAEAIDRQRWMHTGDLATMDEHGYVRVVGRIKDMVIRGGENVYPREIEEFLYTHPQVADVQVIGVPDERYGEELMAWVIARPECELTEAELRDFCRGQIAHFKIPRYVKFVDAFPMTVTGKVQKFKMREAAIEELHLDQAAAVATA
jgi:fatty-acyl-CoA synthase